MIYKRPRGTRDLLPDEMEARREVESILRESFERFGYREVQTPTFESLDLITAKSGEEINHHLYSFKDKSNRKLALRPELSAPTIRLYVNELRTRPKPVKLYYIENCFRYERPQKGRYREFWQAGVELIGSSRPEAEAEVVGLARACLGRLGLEGYTLSIGHLGVIRAYLSENGVDEDLQNTIFGLLDKGDLKSLDELHIPLDVKSGLLEGAALKGPWKDISESAQKIFGESADQELKGLGTLVDKLHAFGVERFNVDLGIARGLDYYTGMVFEIHAEGLGAENQICGGGTYSLVKLVGGGDEPSCGFAFGFDRLMLALGSQGKIVTEASVPRVMVVPSSWKGLNRAIHITTELRNHMSCDLEIMGRKLSKSLSYANSLGIPYVVIIPDSGEDIILRDMQSGEQKEMDQREILDAIR